MYSKLRHQIVPVLLLFNNEYFIVCSHYLDRQLTHRQDIIRSLSLASSCAFLLGHFLVCVFLSVYCRNNPLFFVIYALAYRCTVVGYARFHANIVQFNIDQLVGAFAHELGSIINWHSINGQLYLLYLNLDNVFSTFFFYYVS